MRTRHKLYYALIAPIVSIILLVSASSILFAGINENFVELNESFDWDDYFLAESGTAGNVNQFGAYDFAELNGELIIGIGRARPAEQSGAMLAKFDGTTVTNLGLLNEQGVSSMVRHGDTVVISGADPAPWPTGTPPQYWAWGNVYITDGNAVTKYRETSGLRGVIHMFSVENGGGSTLYAATGSQDGTHDDQTGTCVLSVTCYGEIFKSTNGGSYWESLGQLAPYRNFFVYPWSGKLFAISSDNSNIYYPYAEVSLDEGSSWSSLYFPTNVQRTHAVEFNNQLLYLATSDNVIYGVNPDLTFTTYNLDFQIGVYDAALPTFRNYNQFVKDSDGHLYTIGRGGEIMRTRDLINWDILYDSDKNLISIGYWPSQNAIVTSERGTAGTIWKIDLDEGDATRIYNLSPLLNARDLFTNSDMEIANQSHVGANRLARITSNGGIPIAQFNIDMLIDRNWEDVAAGTDTVNMKSFVHNLSNAEGVLSTYSLFIPKNPEDTQFTLCPNSTSLSEVTHTCAGGVIMSETDFNVVIQTVDSMQYWVVSGLSGTGGISLTAVEESGDDDSGDDDNSNDNGSNNDSSLDLATTGYKIIYVYLTVFITLFVSVTTYVLLKNRKRSE